MNQLPILIRREFWEHRSTFVLLPLVITAFLLSVMMLAYFASTSDVISVNLEMEEQSAVSSQHVESDDLFALLAYRLEALPERERASYINRGMHGLASPLLIAMWFVIFIYLLNSLYSDRRDRSILFWKSLPVSDGITVCSKLLTGLIIVPLIYFAGIAILQLAVLLLMFAATSGTDVSALEVVWGPSALISRWFEYLALLIFYCLWALPFFAWLLVVSAFAQSVPMVWAVGVPFGITVLEHMFFNSTPVSDWMGQHMVPLSFVRERQAIATTIAEQALSLQMISALIVGVALVFVAVRLRGKADEI